MLTKDTYYKALKFALKQGFKSFMYEKGIFSPFKVSYRTFKDTFVTYIECYKII